jgi:ribosomal protein S12 methylthiotransferase accessory factor
MIMNVEIEFPGGLQVAARFGGFQVLTDQSPEHGGGGTAPEPFDLFLAALGTCAGIYALRFCQERGLETRGLSLSLRTEPDPERRRLRAIHLELGLPAGFPERYRAAILRAVDQCAVKRHMIEPPQFSVTAVTADLEMTLASGRTM